jgi:predicted transcriptional regulator
MSDIQPPTDRELEILKILWQRGEATVRQVYEEMRERLPIVQNTVQTFLRTMEEKGLVKHRVDGRTFVYRPCMRRDQTMRGLAARLLEGVFDGAIDQLVDCLFTHRRPSQDELRRLQRLISQARRSTEPVDDQPSRRRK